MDRLYNEYVRCPKCGSGTVSVRFRHDARGERMGRTCARCGYSWSEKPPDSLRAQDGERE